MSRSHVGAGVLSICLAALLLAPLPNADGADAPTRRVRAPAGVAADTAVFAGGCYWGVEAVFEHLGGVVDVVSGFATGDSRSPSSTQVGTGRPKYAESVRVVYDPSRVTYEQLLDVFFRVAHDPTQLDRQGPDVGPQYRSAIFYRDSAQRRAAEAKVAALAASKEFARPIVTEISPFGAFRVADASQQDYLVRHPSDPYIVVNDAPKLVELQRRFPKLYRE
jgi:peptide-methionine (S)-S-oxide reductase